MDVGAWLRGLGLDVGVLMLTIMGGIAEFERGLIRKRCEEGIERAKRKGTKFGRPSALDDGEKRAMAERYAKGETMEQLAKERRRHRQHLEVASIRQRSVVASESHTGP